MLGADKSAKDVTTRLTGIHAHLKDRFLEALQPQSWPGYRFYTMDLSIRHVEKEKIGFHVGIEKRLHCSLGVLGYTH